MEHYTVNNLNKIKNEVQLKNKNITIIAVSKTFTKEKILPLIDHGQKHFGENKVQEAIEKWTKLKTFNKQIKLHLIGKLQSNKVKNILPLFDYIHSLDNLKLAEKISKEQEKKNFKPKLFVQVNIGNEDQKNGIQENKLSDFIKACKNSYNLDIIGLMCLPPNDDNHKFYFSKMKILNQKYGFQDLSMGMSNDYLDAIDYESTYIRVGSKIFGERN